MVRQTQALSGPVTVRLLKPSGGFPAASGILIAVHVLPFQCHATFASVPAIAQMSSGLTTLTWPGTSGSFTFAQARPL